FLGLLLLEQSTSILSQVSLELCYSGFYLRHLEGVRSLNEFEFCHRLARFSLRFFKILRKLLGFRSTLTDQPIDQRHKLRTWNVSEIRKYIFNYNGNFAKRKK